MIQIKKHSNTLFTAAMLVMCVVLFSSFTTNPNPPVAGDPIKLGFIP